MSTLVLPSSKWNIVPSIADNPRASVTSARYSPSVFTFNANWAPAPLAPRPRYSHLHPSDAQPNAATADDAERVSHLDFDSDSDKGEAGNEDDDEDDDDDDGEYAWHRKVTNEYRIGVTDDTHSPVPTPTQSAYPNSKDNLKRSSDPYAVSNAAYLASYGFTDGLGYEHPPPGFLLSTSSSSSSSSIHSADRSGEEEDFDYFKNRDQTGRNDANNSKSLAPQANTRLLSVHDHNRPSHQNTRTGALYANAEYPGAPLSSPWPTSLRDTNALLASLELDTSLRDDPAAAWESLCWDEAAPESDSDADAELEEEGSDFEQAGNEDRRQLSEKARIRMSARGWTGKEISVLENDNQSGGDTWRTFLSSPPSPPPSPTPPVFKPIHGDDSDYDSDTRTISDETLNEMRGTATGVSTRTGTPNGIEAEIETGMVTRSSTLTADLESPEEWIALTGARAQAARARILPWRNPQVFSFGVAGGDDVYNIADVDSNQDWQHGRVSASMDATMPVQADTSMLVTDSGRVMGMGQTRTPIDPVLAATPPLQHFDYPENEYTHSVAEGSFGTFGRRGTSNTVVLADEMIVNGEVGTAQEGTEPETAPHYGESGRDRLVTLPLSLNERDPPPYELAYETGTGMMASSVEDQDQPPADGRAERSESQEEEEASSLSVGSQQESQAQAQPQLLPLPPPLPSHIQTIAHVSLPFPGLPLRTRSQLTFPTSPTETETIPSITSPSSASALGSASDYRPSSPTSVASLSSSARFSPTASSVSRPLSVTSVLPFSPTNTNTSSASATTASPTTTETEAVTPLTTPAGTYFSTLFPIPRRQEESICYSPGWRPSSGASGSGIRKGLGFGGGVGGSRPGSPFSVFSTSGASPRNESFVKVGGRALGERPGTGMGPRPLPARPRGSQRNVGTWLSASAAGPYANGSRMVSDFGSGSGSGLGSESGHGHEFICGTPILKEMRARERREAEWGVRVSREVLYDGDGDDVPSFVETKGHEEGWADRQEGGGEMRFAPSRWEGVYPPSRPYSCAPTPFQGVILPQRTNRTNPSPLAAMSSEEKAKSRSMESVATVTASTSLDRDRGAVKYGYKYEYGFPLHGMKSKVEVGVPWGEGEGESEGKGRTATGARTGTGTGMGMGMGTRNRSASSRVHALQRLATFSRRIGIVSGVGVSTGSGSGSSGR